MLILVVPAYLIVVMFGILASAYLLGGRMITGGGSPHYGRCRPVHSLTALAGGSALAAATAIPFLGGLIVSMLAALGTGASILALSRRYPRACPVDWLHIRDRR